MNNSFPGEVWKPVSFDFEYTNDCRVEVSNYGRIRTFNKIANGNILNGSLINGYRIIRMKFFTSRDPKMQAVLTGFQEQVADLNKQIKTLTKANAPVEELEAAKAALAQVKKKQTAANRKDMKARTIHYHTLIHRLVAQYFVPNNDPAKTIVAHKDYDKLNNLFHNLVWMTPDENYKHQQSSPHVIKDKQERKEKRKEDFKGTKLSVTKVMLMKKLLNQGKSLRSLAKQFKVTDTQIMRIKRGENWADVAAAQ